MKDKGILFKPDMIKATQEDRKTMTRRLEGLKGVNKNPDRYKLNNFFDYDYKKYALFCCKDEPKNLIEIKCPYQIGQKLYVKETWTINKELNKYYENKDDIIYKASYFGYHNLQDYIDSTNWKNHVKWKSPLFMPKKYARLWLEVVDIRIERLQDITDDDAIAEGVGAGFQMNAGYPDYQHIENGICTLTQDTAEMSFATLWDSIHKKNPEYLWNKNPWNWPITFKRIKQ